MLIVVIRRVFVGKEGNVLLAAVLEIVGKVENVLFGALLEIDGGEGNVLVKLFEIVDEAGDPLVGALLKNWIRLVFWVRPLDVLCGVLVVKIGSVVCGTMAGNVLRGIVVDLRFNVDFFRVVGGLRVVK